MKKIRVGIIGFGVSGRFFHGPFLRAHEGFDVLMVSSSQTDIVRSVLPGVSVVSDPGMIIKNPDVDLVINCAPTQFHFSYTEKALLAGKHVVVEKPFVVSSVDGLRLIELAKSSGKILSVFQNRRWDGDFLTIQYLLQENRLGQIKQFESYFDRWRPVVRPERWRETSVPGSGSFYDLGSHLIDQTLVLFGLPTEIFADIVLQKSNAQSDDYFHVVLKYPNHRVLLHSSSFSNTSPRFRVLGDKGSFTKFGLDPQEEQLRGGLSISDPLFGQESPEDYGRLVFPDTHQTQELPTQRGVYTDYFKQLHLCLTEGKPNPVPAEEALNVIHLIELGIRSSNEKSSIFINIRQS